MKKISKIFLIIVMLFSLVGCTKTDGGVEKTEKTDAVRFKEEYEELNGSRNDSGKVIRVVSIPEENPIIYATAEDIVKMMDNGLSFYVYFGFAKCPWCRSMIEQMFKAAEAHGVKQIYYVDVLDIRDTKEVSEDGEVVTSKDGDEYYMQLIDRIGNVLSDYTLTDADGNEVSANEKRIYAPNIVVFENGEATQLTEGTADGLEDPYSELSEDMIKNSYEKLECVFKCLENDSNVCVKNAC